MTQPWRKGGLEGCPRRHQVIVFAPNCIDQHRPMDHAYGRRMNEARLASFEMFSKLFLGESAIHIGIGRWT